MAEVIEADMEDMEVGIGEAGLDFLFCYLFLDLEEEAFLVF